MARRTFKWCLPYEHAIVQAWGKFAEDIRGQKRNGHVYMEMTQHLQNQGCQMSRIELKNKIHNLTTRYKKETEKIRRSGGTSSNWVHYDKVHEILSRPKIQNEKFLLEESVSCDSLYDGPSSSASQSSITAPPAPDASAPPASDPQTTDTTVIVPPASNPPNSASPASNPPNSASPALSSQDAGAGAPAASTQASTGYKELRTKSSSAARKKSFQKLVLQKFNQIEEETKKQSEEIIKNDAELLKLEQEKLETMKEYLREFKDLKNSLVYLLNRN